MTEGIRSKVTSSEALDQAPPGSASHLDDSQVHVLRQHECVSFTRNTSVF